MLKLVSHEISSPVREQLCVPFDAFLQLNAGLKDYAELVFLLAVRGRDARLKVLYIGR